MKARRSAGGHGSSFWAMGVFLKAIKTATILCAWCGPSNSARRSYWGDSIQLKNSGDWARDLNRAAEFGLVVSFAAGRDEKTKTRCLFGGVKFTATVI